jgi:hypothetical protein
VSKKWLMGGGNDYCFITCNDTPKKMPLSIIPKTFLCLVSQIRLTDISKPEERSKTVHRTLLFPLFTEFFL